MKKNADIQGVFIETKETRFRFWLKTFSLFFIFAFFCQTAQISYLYAQGDNEYDSGESDYADSGGYDESGGEAGSGDELYDPAADFGYGGDGYEAEQEPVNSDSESFNENGFDDTFDPYANDTTGVIDDTAEEDYSTPVYYDEEDDYGDPYVQQKHSVGIDSIGDLYFDENPEANNTRIIIDPAYANPEAGMGVANYESEGIFPDTEEIPIDIPFEDYTGEVGDEAPTDEPEAIPISQIIGQEYPE